MTDIFSSRGAVTAHDRNERARAAVRAFRQMQPTLTSYARILTGKPNVRVEVSPDSNGMTDGKRIFFRPPIALGDPTSHDRRLCDKRDPSTKQQLCPACRIREQVLIVIYHEIGHIAEDSFAQTSDEDRAKLVKNALDQVNKNFVKAVQQRIEMTPEYVKDSYIGMARLVSPFLPGIVNALEDARVNRGVMTARKGTKAMFEADTHRIFDRGVEQKDPLTGEIIYKKWRDYPLNMQAAVALYVKVSGYDIKDWFVPEVVAAIDDAEVQSILHQFKTVRNVSGIYAMSIPLLVRLRQLGFFKAPTDPQVEEENDGTEDVSDSGEQPPSPEQGAGGDKRPPHEDNSDSDAEERDSGEDSAGAPEGDESSPEDSGPSEGGESADSEAGEEGTGDGARDDDDTDDGSLGSKSAQSSGSSSEESDADVPDDPESGQSDSSGSSEADASGTGGTLNEEHEGEGDDSSESTTEGKTNGGSSEESGPDAEGGPGELGSQAESDARTGGNNDSTETGTDVQDLDDKEVLDTEPLGESGTVPRDPVDGDTGHGDSSDSISPEADEVQREDLDERADDDSGTESDDGSAEPIDSGADEGLGGVEVKENSAFDRLPMGTPEEVEGALHDVGHPENRPDYVEENDEEAEALEKAVIQGIYFETPSRRVFGVREHYWNKPVVVNGYDMSQGWNNSGRRAIGYTDRRLGIAGDFDTSEKVLGPGLLRMRVAFADNKRGKDLRNRKSGKVDARVLGRRAFHDDERLFKKHLIPGKKDYFVLIGIDISGSTAGSNIVLAKQAAMGQAELCHRSGIQFAVYAHSGKMHDPLGGRRAGTDVDIYHIKDPDEPWNEHTKERLTSLGPDSQNLDGHTFEYYRKILDKRPETDKVMLYYTDGKMPAENHDEELEILTREIKICRSKRYALVGVGIRTDSPLRHGLDTVQIDSVEDVVKVVRHLEKVLLAI